MENSKSVQPESMGSKSWLSFTIGFVMGFLAGIIVAGLLLFLWLVPVTRVTG